MTMRNALHTLLCPTDWPHHNQGGLELAAVSAYVPSAVSEAMTLLSRPANQKAEHVEHTDSL